MNKSFFQTALYEFEQGQLDKAIDSARLGLRENPRDIDLLHLMGVISGQQGKHSDAEKFLRMASSLCQENSYIWLNLSNALSELGKNDEAVECIVRSLTLDSSNYDAWLNYSKLLLRLERYSEAFEASAKAIELNPERAEGWFNQGLSNHQMRQYEKALASFDRALEINSRLAECFFAKGNTYSELRQSEQAAKNFQLALSIDSRHSKALRNLGLYFLETNDFSRAIDCFERAFLLNPSMDFLFGDLLHARAKICDWSSFDNQIKKLHAGLLEGNRICHPFPLLSLVDDEKAHLLAAELLSQIANPAKDSHLRSVKEFSSGKVRVGYFSADFHEHATMHLMAEIFEAHSEDLFEIYCFSFGPSFDDSFRQRLIKSVDHFFDVNDFSDSQVAKLSRDLEIHIAVDLKGHTLYSRLGIFANRCAPIQISYLGYPGTLGADFIDYVIADEFVIPRKSLSSYKEKVIYVPGSYQPNDSKRARPSHSITRGEYGLPHDKFIFCCFNNSYKIQPTIVALWAQVLQFVPDSILWLLADNEIVSTNLRLSFQKLGIDPVRVIFTGRCSYLEHLSRLRLGDLFLDTFPYNAHTTASEALWMTLPVLTLSGQSFASRVAGSLLSELGLSELIVSTEQDYVKKAVTLANDHVRMSLIRAQLESSRINSRLFNGVDKCRALEKAYLSCIERWKQNLPPAVIRID